MINGSPLEPGRNHQAVLSLLQQPGETVELVVARDRAASGGPAEWPVGTVSGRFYWVLLRHNGF